jgi:hypothetical protein
MMFLLGINIVLQVGDLLQLKVKDIKGKKNVMMKEGKTGKPRTIYLKSIYDGKKSALFYELGHLTE